MRGESTVRERKGERGYSKKCLSEQTLNLVPFIFGFLFRSKLICFAFQSQHLDEGKRKLLKNY